MRVKAADGWLEYERVRVIGRGAAGFVVLCTRKRDGRAVVIKEQVNFDFDRAVLRAESASVLDEVAATLLARPEIARVEIQGHTDNTGTPAGSDSRRS